MSIAKVVATITCDGCGKQFRVEVDTGSCMPLFEAVNDAVRDGEHEFAVPLKKEPESGCVCIDGGAGVTHLCGVCCDAEKAELARDKADDAMQARIEAKEYRGEKLTVEEAAFMEPDDGDYADPDGWADPAQVWPENEREDHGL